MGLVELAMIYAGVGTGCAVVALARGRARDAPLLLMLWPLYGPFALSRPDPPPPPSSPLAVLLPDEHTMTALRRRVEEGRQRAAAIASLLARPEFCQAAGLETIGRLAALEKRLRDELEQVGSLLIQLTAQAEVVRLVGAGEPTSRELVRELAARVEGLDHMLAEELDRDP
jgi:hypothetical protein